MNLANAFHLRDRPAVRTLATVAATLLVATSAWLAPFAKAHAGPEHDHGDEAAAAPASASPRVESHSDAFELVGVVAPGGVLRIYLDRYATNEPVAGARIEVDAGAAKGVAAPQPDGTYRFQHASLGKPGSVPMTFTIQAGEQADLLAGDLVITDPHAQEDEAAAGMSMWQRALGLRWAGALVAALLVAGTAWALRRRRVGGNARSAQHTLALVLPSVATALVAGAASWTGAAHAGPEHDHGENRTATAVSDAPRREADGSVFLPKTSQRQLGVRTLLAESKALPRSVELAGRVVADPNAGGKVQPLQAGRVEAGPRGLPTLGQAVRKGEVLAMVRPAVGTVERANQQAQSAELQASLELALKRVARLEQLEGTVPAKEIEAARSEAQGLRQRAQAVAGSLTGAEQLLAPVSGVIASANVVAGQVVDAREVVFEIVDPSRLSVEASAFDAALVQDIAGASVAVGTSSLPLRFVGGGRTLREGAIPLLFRSAGQGAHLPLAVGQPVKVVAQTRRQVTGVPVPATAVVKSPSNQDTVWVHTAAERFEPRPVRLEPLDGATVSVTDGLKAGDRVVTQGAALVSQVR